MINEELKPLMLRFLERNYSISRIKHDSRFKRAIIVDREPYFLSDWGSLLQLQVKLDEILNIVFDTEESTNLDVLTKFLNLRKQKR